MIISDGYEVDGTFYVFYDKFQLIQSRQVPKYFFDADCKLILYKMPKYREYCNYIVKTNIRKNTETV